MRLIIGDSKKNILADKTMSKNKRYVLNLSAPTSITITMVEIKKQKHIVVILTTEEASNEKK